jgi:type III secretory pathway component EscR
MGRLLGFGTVTVRTYTGDLQFKRLPYPYVIFEMLETRREAAAVESTQAEKQEIRQALSGRSDPSSRRNLASGPKNQTPNAFEQSGSFSAIMAKMFNLRTEKEDSVVYRTHWWILLKKTSLPSLFLLVIVFTVLARILGFISIIPELVVYIGALILALACWGWWFYRYQDWQNDVYIINDDQLIDVYKKPLGMDDRRSAPVKNIQTVEFERKGLINLMLNFGTVKIKIGNEELTFDNVYQPSEVQAEIYTRYRATLETAKKNEQQKFVEWIKTYEEIQKENQRANDDENG